MKSTFTIPGRLPGLNEVVDAARTHWSKGALHKKQFTDLCGWYVRAARVPVFKTPVEVHIAWFEANKKRDLDNVQAGAKFILDALVATERIENDGPQYVRLVRHEVKVDPVNPRIEVTIKEARE